MAFVLLSNEQRGTGQDGSRRTRMTRASSRGSHERNGQSRERLHGRGTASSSRSGRSGGSSAERSSNKARAPGNNGAHVGRSWKRAEWAASSGHAQGKSSSTRGAAATLVSANGSTARRLRGAVTRTRSNGAKRGSGARRDNGGEAAGNAIDKKLKAALQKLAVIKEHYQNPKPLPSPRSVTSRPSSQSRPTTAKSSEETRLRAAEALIGRLYARIKSLETELEYARGGQGAGSHAPMNGYHGPGGVVSSPMTHGGYGGPDTPMGSPPVAFGTPRSQQVDQASPRGLGTTGDLDASIDINDDPDTEGVDMLIEIHVQSEKRLRNLVEQRDDQIIQLRKIIQTIRKSSTPAQKNVVDQQTLTDLKRDNEELKKRYDQAVKDANRYQTGYLKARADYRKLVAARLKKATEYGGNVTGAARNLLKVLGERLNSSEKEREAEAAAFNRKLVAAEQQNCDWYVEKKLRDERIAELSAEIAEHNALEDKMEMCVHSLFERLKQLEVTNHKLRAKVAAVTGRSVSSIGRTPTPGGTRPSSRGLAQSGGAGSFTPSSAGGARGSRQGSNAASARFARAAAGVGSGGGAGGTGDGDGSARESGARHPMASMSMPQVMPQPYSMPDTVSAAMRATQSFDNMGRLAIGPPPLAVHDSVAQLPVSPQSSPHPGQSAASARLARLRKISRRTQPGPTE